MVYGIRDVVGWKFVNCRGRGEEVPGPSKIMASTIHEDQKTTETSALRGAEGRQDPEVTLFENFVSQEEAPIVHPRRFGRRWSISSRSARAVGSGRRSRRATWVPEVEVLSGPEASDLHGLNTGSAEHPLGAGHRRLRRAFEWPRKRATATRARPAAFTCSGMRPSSRWALWAQHSLMRIAGAYCRPSGCGDPNQAGSGPELHRPTSFGP